MNLAEKRPIEPGTLEEIQRLQYVVSKAEEYIGKSGSIGIREAIFRLSGIGNLEGGRVPMRGKLADGEWESLRRTYLAEITRVEASL